MKHLIAIGMFLALVPALRAQPDSSLHVVYSSISWTREAQVSQTFKDSLKYLFDQHFENCQLQFWPDNTTAKAILDSFPNSIAITLGDFYKRVVNNPGVCCLGDCMDWGVLSQVDMTKAGKKLPSLLLGEDCLNPKQIEEVAQAFKHPQTSQIIGNKLLLIQNLQDRRPGVNAAYIFHLAKQYGYSRILEKQVDTILQATRKGDEFVFALVGRKHEGRNKIYYVDAETRQLLRTETADLNWDATDGKWRNNPSEKLEKALETKKLLRLCYNNENCLLSYVHLKNRYGRDKMLEKGEPGYFNLPKSERPPCILVLSMEDPTGNYLFEYVESETGEVLKREHVVVEFPKNNPRLPRRKFQKPR